METPHLGMDVPRSLIPWAASGCGFLISSHLLQEASLMMKSEQGTDP